MVKVITKDVRGINARSEAIGLLLFKDNRVELEFNETAASYEAKVMEWGTYALNPFTFNTLLSEFRDKKVVVRLMREEFRLVILGWIIRDSTGFGSFRGSQFVFGKNIEKKI